MTKGEQTQVQKRTGLAKATGYQEGLTYDPFEIALVVPEPPDDIKIEIRVSLDDGPERLHTFGKKDIVGPNDSFARGLGWDATFRWAQQSAKAKREFEQHVVTLLNGHEPKQVTCQHEKGQAFPVTTEGRHSVFASRVANLIRARLKMPLDMLGFRKRKATEASAAVIADLGNRHYDRDPLDVIEQRLYQIEIHGWSDKQAAEFFSVAPATVRSWRHRADGAPKKERSGPVVRGLGRKQVRVLSKKLADLNLPGVNNTLIREVVHVIATGTLPEGASDKVRHVFEGILI